MAGEPDPSRIRDGKLYGCHVDLDEGEQPDGCVIEYGGHSDCIYGHLPGGRKRRSAFTCKWWKPVTRLSSPTPDDLYEGD